jgi:aubergine-like protein
LRRCLGMLNLTLWKRDYYDPAAATEIPVSYLLSFQMFII